MQLSKSFTLLCSYIAIAPFVSAVPYLPSPEPRQSNNKSVIIQLFEWNWSSIGAECKNFIGPAGYGAVQVNTASEHLQGDAWWTDYQVVSYKLQSKRGSRDEFKAMIDACHSAGVKVIVDTVLNHMAGVDSGTGTAGSSFTHYDYPGVYSNADFHHCGINPNDDIKNYDAKPEAQICELANLADLKTESDYVQGKLAAHVYDLLSLGVDGLRLDAAKHIPASDIKAILSKSSLKPSYITQEVVVWSNNGGIRASEYTGIGQVQEFRYSAKMKNSFNGGDLTTLQNLDSYGWVSSKDANVFVVNHDGERGNYALNAASPSNTYTLAQIFSLAHPYGTPTVMSSYQGFSSAGGPNGGYGTCSGDSGSNGWYCQHRWTPVQGMVGFRNSVGSSQLSNWTADGKTRIAFGRGSNGFVAINNNDSVWKATFTTSLRDGSYCDVISGKLNSGSCTGTQITVKGGKISVRVQARSAIAVHVGARK